jgi:hypothetical protein
MKTTTQTITGSVTTTTNNLRVLNLILLFAILAFFTGCGVAPVRHTPKVTALAGNKMSDLRASKPIDVKSGECSSAEKVIGTVGVGKVIGNLAEWTDVTVEAVKTNLVSRGATITTGVPKVLTITMTDAHVGAIPFVGVSKSRIVLTATAPDGLNSTFEGSSSSMAPLGAVNGAVADAVKKLLMDAAVEEYVRK